MRMKNKLLIIGLSSLIIFIFLLAFFNIRVSSYQGINYAVKELKIPLYIKIIDFVSRDYHYHDLVNRTIKGARTEEEKVLRIFYWTLDNIREVPAGYPIIDDHVWHVIIRGYGTDDQAADVLATLCMYAGLPATWFKACPKDSPLWLAVTLVRIKGCWFILDPARGNYFTNEKGDLATVEEIIKDNSLVLRAKNKPIVHGIEYARYFENIPSTIKNEENFKARQQIFMPRVTLEIKKIFKKIFGKIN